MKTLITATLFLASSLAHADVKAKPQSTIQAFPLGDAAGTSIVAPETTDAKFFRITIDLQMDGLILRGFEAKYKDSTDVAVKDAVENANAAYDAALISYSETMDEDAPDYDKVDKRMTIALKMISMIPRAAGDVK